jgi:hypothetical protein
MPTTPIDPKSRRVVCLNEAAAILGVSPGSLYGRHYRAKNSGHDTPFYKKHSEIGQGQLVARLDRLLAWLDNQPRGRRLYPRRNPPK